MFKLRILICKLHIIVREATGNKQQERFFPIMFIALWVTITSLNIFRLITGQDFDSRELVEHQNNLDNLLGVVLFLSTSLIVFIATYNEPIYRSSEKWLDSLSTDIRDKVITVVFSSMLIIFFGLLIWRVATA